MFVVQAAAGFIIDEIKKKLFFIDGTETIKAVNGLISSKKKCQN